MLELPLLSVHRVSEEVRDTLGQVCLTVDVGGEEEIGWKGRDGMGWTGRAGRDGTGRMRWDGKDGMRWDGRDGKVVELCFQFLSFIILRARRLISRVLAE